MLLNLRLNSYRKLVKEITQVSYGIAYHYYYISRNNTNQYIKYRNVKLNLDQNKSKHAEDVFKQFQDAYDVLKNPSLKATYEPHGASPDTLSNRKILIGRLANQKRIWEKTARNLAILNKSQGHELCLLGLPLFIGYMSFFSGDDNNYEKFKDSKPALNNRKYRKQNRKMERDRKTSIYVQKSKNPAVGATFAAIWPVGYIITGKLISRSEGWDWDLNMSNFVCCLGAWWFLSVNTVLSKKAEVLL